MLINVIPRVEPAVSYSLCSQDLFPLTVSNVRAELGRKVRLSKSPQCSGAGLTGCWKQLHLDINVLNVDECFFLRVLCLKPRPLLPVSSKTLNKTLLVVKKRLKGDILCSISGS